MLSNIPYSYCSAQNNPYNLRLDTLSIDGAFHNEFRWHKTLLKFDSVQIELYLNNKRVGIISQTLMRYLDKETISSIEWSQEVIKDEGTLLRIKVFLKQLQ